MTAAALVGLLLLLIVGLSLRDWRDLGEGAGRRAGRLAAISGRGTIAAAGFGAPPVRPLARGAGRRRAAPVGAAAARRPGASRSSTAPSHRPNRRRWWPNPGGSPA